MVKNPWKLELFYISHREYENPSGIIAPETGEMNVPTEGPTNR